MPDARRRPGQPDLDLLEYLLVSAPAADGLAVVGEAVAGLVRVGSIRLLDAVLLVRKGSAARVDSAPLGEHAGLSALRAVAEGGVQLSSHDIELAALTLEPDETALLLLVEDSWAGPLSAAARAGGARGISGERIARDRAIRSLDHQGRGDLIVRGPGIVPLVDQVEPVRQLARLVERGLLPLDRYEVQRRRVLGC